MTTKLLSSIALAVLLSACQSNKAPTYEPYQPITTTTGEPITLQIAPNRVACNSPLPMQCVSATTQSGETLTIAYNAIEGFNPSVGTSYTVRVRPQYTQNQVLHRFILDEILSQKISH